MRHRSGPEDLVRAAARFGVRDQRVLAAVGAVRRERFVPTGSERHAYRDRPVPIGQRQTTSQPSLIAGMVEALRPEPHHEVLEVGTGYGYQTALLARLVRRVWSVERHEELARQAAGNLEAAGITNATVQTGDGTLGWAEHAPYDGIVVSAAAPAVPQPLVDQLAGGGRLVMPVGPGGAEEVVVFTERGAGLERVGTLTPARFVPLLGEHGLPER